MFTKKQIKIINVVNTIMKRKRGIKMEDNIELVIKIPKGIYVASQMLGVKHGDTVQIPLEIIANGTPLPKGHGRLIDENEIWDAVPDISSPLENHFKTYDFCRFLANTPTVVEADKNESEE